MYSFHKKEKVLYPKLKLNGKKLPFVPSHPFLGVTLYYRLNWHTHLRLVKIKVLKSLDTVKMLRNRRFGPDPQRLLFIYRTLLRSILEYGCMAYVDAAPTTTLDSVHNAGIRIAIRTYPTTPVPEMQILCGEVPLSIRRIFLTLKYCAKIADMHDHINYE